MDLQDLNAFRSVDELVAYREQIDSRLAELDSAAAGKPLDDEARTEWDALTDHRTEVVARIEELQARADYLRMISDNPKHTERAATVTSRPNGGSRIPDNVFDMVAYRQSSRSEADYANLLVDGARKAADMASFPHPNADRDAIVADLHRTLANVKQPGILAQRILSTGSELYGRAFAKLLTAQGLSSDEQTALATAKEIGALTLGTDNAGGYAVPFQLDPTIILTSDGSINPLRQPGWARVERVTGKTWEGITSAGASVVRGDETDEAPDTQFTLAQPEVQTHEVKAFVRFSIKLQTAWGAVLSEIARVITDAKDAEEADSFVNGDGVTGQQAGGIVGSMPAGSEVNSAAVNTFAEVDVYKIKNQTPPRFRGRGRYLGESSIYDLIRQFEAATGTSVWVAGLNADPPVMAGKRVGEISTMDATAATGDKPLVFGDFSQFLIVDRIGMNVEIVQHVLGANRRPTGERGVFAMWSNNSKILVPEAFRLLVIA
jgi:HK97 family phage major capsid protein